MEKFFSACASGNLRKIKNQLRFQDISDSVISQGIFIAGKTGNIETMEFLRNRKPDLVDPNYLLRYACYFGKIQVVKHLLAPERKFKADLNHNNSVSLSWAIENRKDQVVNYLLEMKANTRFLEKRHLCIACRRKNFDLVKIILENGVEPTRECNVFILDAAASGNLDIVRYLHEQKVSLGDMVLFCPLNEAARNNHFHIVKYILDDSIGVKDLDQVFQFGFNYSFNMTLFLLRKKKEFFGLRPYERIHFSVLKAWRRWRIKIFLRKLFRVALPLYYSPGFPGYFRGRKEVEGMIKDFSPN